jgi:hypothetical protein
MSDYKNKSKGNFVIKDPEVTGSTTEKDTFGGTTPTTLLDDNNINNNKKNINSKNENSSTTAKNATTTTIGEEGLGRLQQQQQGEDDYDDDEFTGQLKKKKQQQQQQVSGDRQSSQFVNEDVEEEEGGRGSQVSGFTLVSFSAVSFRLLCFILPFSPFLTYSDRVGKYTNKHHILRLTLYLATCQGIADLEQDTISLGLWSRKK